MTKATLIAEPGQHEVVMSRVFDAPRELVFKVMTDPKRIPQWWGKRNHITVVDKMEVRAGGLWRYIERDEQGNEFAFHGVYHAITAPEQIVDTFEFEGMPGHVMLETLTLEAQADGKTCLTVSSVFQSVADRDGMLRSGMEEGANESYDRLDELLVDNVRRLRMKTVVSKDGTIIAFDQVGQGPSVILVNGALGVRSFPIMADLAARLAPDFTVINYDRRGRGDSTNTLPYAVEREIEDIEALIDRAGGTACLYGLSSGAALAMEAAIALGDKVKKLAMYEAPYNSDETARQAWKTYRKDINELLAAGRQGDAVVRFMLYVGMPPEHVSGVRQHPMWPMFESAAPTLAYDAAVLGDEAAVPTERAACVAVPTLVMDGGASYPFMHISAMALAKAMPHAQQRTLEGQTHEVAAEVIAPVLVEFFNSSAVTR